MLYSIKQVLNQTAGILITLLRIVRKPIVLKGNVLPVISSTKLDILGNGPSLREYLDSGDNESRNSDIMVVNKFCLSIDYEKVKPEHYVIVDSDFLVETKDESLQKMQKDMYEKFTETTTWKMNLYLPQNSSGLVFKERITKANKNISIFHFNMLTLDGSERFRYFLYKRGVGMPFAGNVLIVANMLAINLGYSNIELFGAEHSIHTQAYINSKNQVALEYKYFDGTSAEFIFWDDLNPEEPQKYHQYLTHWKDTFRAYHEVAAYAKYKHCKIINRTENSFIDAFKRGEQV